MVRTAIACARCRRSKVKCFHSGQAPCRGCQKAGSEASECCVLSGPLLRKRQTAPRHVPPPPRLPQPEEHTSAAGHVFENSHLSQSAAPQYDHQDGDLAIPVTLVLRAAQAFNRKFRELSFLHIPNFKKLVRQVSQVIDGSPESLVLGCSGGFATITALCAALVAIASPLIDPDLPRQRYATIAKHHVSFDDFPDIHSVQTLLVLAAYEWGNGKPYRAWICSGAATRMMQLITSMQNTSSYSQLQQEIHNRTFWSCFVLDKLIFCGKPQQPILPLDAVDTHWPSRGSDFAFGQNNNKSYPYTPLDSLGLSVIDEIDDYYALLVQGVDICSEILKWVVSGGRRHPTIITSKRAPWTKGSTWNNAYSRLQKWRQRHGSRLRFPGASIDAHVSLGSGNGEAFAYLNLVYYVGILFLCREYIPFIPTLESRPTGPIDPPLLEEIAPVCWWEDRSRELFEASASITAILRELQEADSPLMTPFAGFCAFSAATMNIYVASFPQMNLGRSTSGRSDYESDLVYLARFRGLWPMGDGWWTTIQRTESLYQRASRDFTRFEGKTRDDFVALHSSIHDYTGISLEDDEDISSDAPSLSQDDPDSAQHNPAGCHQGLGVQEVPPSDFAGHPLDPTAIPEWNGMWSLWGESQIVPSFGIDETSYTNHFNDALGFG
ncbi:putative fungal-specific transcription factor [Xylariales sp. PMI_506]|nr:putative fungal-specific transcription factor [Xylariales sp. PMI_506]